MFAGKWDDPSMPLSASKEPVSSKHGEEVATGSIIAETSTVQGSACPTVQAQGDRFLNIESRLKVRSSFLPPAPYDSSWWKPRQANKSGKKVSRRKRRTPGNASVSPCFKGGELITDSSQGILFYQSNYNDSNSILTSYPFAEGRRIREGAKPDYSTSKGLSWIAHFQIDGIWASHLSWKGEFN